VVLISSQVPTTEEPEVTGDELINMEMHSSPAADSCECRRFQPSSGGYRGLLPQLPLMKYRESERSGPRSRTLSTSMVVRDRSLLLSHLKRKFGAMTK